LNKKIKRASTNVGLVLGLWVGQGKTKENLERKNEEKKKLTGKRPQSTDTEFERSG